MNKLAYLLFSLALCLFAGSGWVAWKKYSATSHGTESADLCRQTKNQGEAPPVKGLWPSVYAISEDCSLVVVGGSNGMLHAFDRTTGKILGEAKNAHTSRIEHLLILPGGKRLVSSAIRKHVSEDITIHVWSLPNLELLTKLVSVPSTVDYKDNTKAALAYDASRGILFTANASLQAWRLPLDAALPLEIREPMAELILRSRAAGLAVHSASSLIGIAADYKVVLVNYQPDASNTTDLKLSVVAEKALTRGTKDWTLAAAFSKDGTKLVSASRFKRVQVWTTSGLDEEGADWTAAAGERNEYYVRETSGSAIPLQPQDGARILAVHEGLGLNGLKGLQNGRLILRTESSAVHFRDATNPEKTRFIIPPS